MAEEEISEGAAPGATDEGEGARLLEVDDLAAARASAPEVVDPVACYERAQHRLEAGDTLEALALLERAHKAAPEDANICSWLGVLLAQERGQTKRGLELCATALERDSSCPTHFYHCAKVHLRGGDKMTAIDVLRDGMRAHPEDEQLRGALVSLGIRKPPPFKGLARAHPLNKYTGILLTRLGLR